ncbi:MAG: L,D-transpeptidase family protein [Opitutae bacterium]|nr:L,D-transpeptidase family protein [Opitutae bacterium]
MLTWSACQPVDRDAALPAERVPAGARQAIWVRPTQGFHALLTAWERTAAGWQRVSGPWPAVVGRRGVAPLGEKREGDGRTPSGTYDLKRAFGAAATLPTGLAYRQATAEDFWVDDATSPLYNQWVHGKPAVKSCEKMTPKGGDYDLGAVIEYNTSPIVPGHGSAIFLHIWSENGKKGTSGCVAVEKANMAALLRWLDAKAEPVIVIDAPPPAAKP